jgi:predicted TIM-barrel fold metal-dependent hydrolase
MSNLVIVSADCHAGALPAAYKEYMPERFHEASDQWWLQYIREMIVRTGTFFDQEAVEEYTDKAGEGGTRWSQMSQLPNQIEDADLWAMLTDENTAFAPRRGEWDTSTRLAELEADGVAGEIIFPQMAPFGAGLLQYRNPVDPAANLEGVRAYNRWLADLCNANPGRHAGVALINVDDIEVTCQEILETRKLGLWGGVLLPTSTGEHPFYHHPRYEPLWELCASEGILVHSHSGWSPDYGDVPSATAMYISEVAMWAHRPFTAMLWAGAFERHPDLHLVLTETGCSWILETLRLMEWKVDLPFFQHFSQGLSLRPTEYFQRQCHLGASFLEPHEGADRHRIGVNKLMWGSDYPHLEGTWPNTMDALRTTFAEYPEEETRAILGGTAAGLYGFDRQLLESVAERIGPSLDQIQTAA